MNRIEAYISIIQALLHCPTGGEIEILRATEELLDAGLVQTMEQATAVMAEKGFTDEAAFLYALAETIARRIGYSPSLSATEVAEYLRFLIRALDGVANSQGNPQVVYSILEVNLDKIDNYFASLLRVWLGLTLPRVNHQQAVFLARLIGNFGTFIKVFPQGEAAYNLEVAITSFKSILPIYTKEAFPREWSVIQNDLGNTYKERILGNKSENLEKSLSCYQLALQVLTKAALPELWAMTQFNMGQTYMERIQGNREDNLERAITCYKNALQVDTSNYPQLSDWASGNLEYARHLLQQGDIYTPEQDIQPIDTLSETEQSFLILVLREIWHNGLNQQVIYPLLQANIQQLTRKFVEILRTWARTTLNKVSSNQARNIATVIYHFSTLIRDFPLGDKSTNLEIAIAGYEVASPIHTRTEFPEHWAELQINLGIAYEERIDGNQAEKWEQAIACYENAGQIFTREAFSYQWAWVQDNLGNAYRNRVKGDKEENLERAIAYYENALQVRTRQAFPGDWGITKHNLGQAYFALRSRDIEENTETAIRHHQDALEVQNREDFPNLWALNQMSLGNIYSFRFRGNLAENLQQALNYYQNALQVYTAEDFPLQNQQVVENQTRTNQFMQKLREHFSKTIADQEPEPLFVLKVLFTALNSQDNPQVLYSFLEKNIEHLNEEFIKELQSIGSNVALNIKNVAKAESLLGVLSGLGIFSSLIKKFPLGNPEINLEIAIAGYEIISLLPRDSSASPDIWALNQSMLGFAYFEKFEKRWGDQQENLEKAIVCLKNALPDYPFEELPEDWALQQGMLGDAYRHRRQGDRAENMEKALATYQTALERYQPNPRTEAWASLQNRLGIGYFERLKGGTADNIETAISAYEQALSVFKSETHREKWAMVQMNMGNAYQKRQGNSLENLNQAIKHYQEALKVRQRATFPQEWADTQINLSEAYYSLGLLGHRDKAEDFERAIQCLKEAGEIYTRQENPDKWAHIQHNLGVGYSDRVKGNKAENIESAIERLNAALQIRTQKEYPYEWALTLKNLAAVYDERIRGNRQANIELAIDFYQRSLIIFNRENYSHDWAETQGNLGIAYKRLFKAREGSSLEQIIKDLEKAIEHLNKAAQIFQRDRNINSFARTQFELGTCYKDLGHICEINPDENLEKSIQCYQNALAIIKRDISPFLWAECQNSLANAYRHRVQGQKAENHKEAILGFKEALKIHSSQAFPKDYIKTCANLGHAYLEIGKLEPAYYSFKEAIETVESLRGKFTTDDDAKRKLAEEWIQVYQRIVEVCLQIGKTEPEYYAKAWEYAERSKAQTLVELLGSQQIVSTGDIPETLWTELKHLRVTISHQEKILEDEERWARLEYNDVKVDNPDKEINLPDRTKLKKLKEQFDQKLKEANCIAPGFSLTQRVEPQPFGGIRGLLPDDSTAIIEWYILEQGKKFCTFIFTRQSLQPILWESSQKDLEDLQNWQTEYLITYLDQEQRNQWQNKLPDRLQRLAQILHIDEIIAKLPSTCQQIILIPHRYLHLFPLHALPVNQGTWLQLNQATKDLQRPTNPCLLDCFKRGVRYAPSCQTLIVSQARKRPDFNQIFAIQNPTQDLDYADIEVQAILRHFSPIKVLPGLEATKLACTHTYVDELYSSHCLHFSCHGTFDVVSPLDQSGLQLADEFLNMGEIFGLDLRKCRLVVLSACETGLTDFSSISDEYIGLPSGFLYAGSPSIVSSLWAVDDCSTALLMIKLYENLQDPQAYPTIAIALNQAQLWLRNATAAELLEWTNGLNLDENLTKQTQKKLHRRAPGEQPFHHPYYWAAFCAIGQ
ncbi:MAG TPA: hypothetical protein DEG17_10755 [Cyanobacteria bacterium UBA11149]|nr:hypothetical protein [Cyanobacteria bacterium UBA11367]HBE56233.1 hypothetical protein [Cyanobacteria bacterium UBA11366]HBK64654.1 hypothetical protein [Cyanobacteria bacterium UBA11166]HBR76218.1 hypothetical protein [Cyanobacteria bacterium UBA11159]HBS69969.1 hypothetical protein [Cyanobacteria bacterium UBA11153]HBW89328.1 hypothetical protein [Cyanobacteria bacterium UBA11149]HCA94236.1 hypothetical protein [Cyanobacteria bacterium UBA9226]